MKHTSFSMPDDMIAKIESFLSGTESISQFAFKATEEKVKRMEVRDRTARAQLHEKNIEYLMPIVEDILKERGLI